MRGRREDHWSRRERAQENTVQQTGAMADDRLDARSSGVPNGRGRPVAMTRLAPAGDAGELIRSY